MGTPGNLIASIIFAFLVFPAISRAKLFNYSKSHFVVADLNSDLINLGESSVEYGALQITPDSSNDDFSLLHKSGRIMLKNSFKLWEETDSSDNNSSSDIVASFNSTFDINIFHKADKKPGEGFAFIIAPDLNFPAASDGQWLGLTNATIDGNTNNMIVAIELDTVKQEDFDPDGNHIGLDINSVRSNKTVPLSNINIEISPTNPANYTVWIQYDGKSKVMKVYMAKQGENKPLEPVLREELNLKNYVKQKSFMGFAASTGNTSQLNCVLKWELTVEVLPEGRKWVKIVIGVSVAVVVLFLIFAAWLRYYLRKRKRITNHPNILGALRSLPATPREFSFKDLKKATNNFDEKMKLGQGGFGVVYKGVLPTENDEVAVKKFSRENMKGIDDFLSELTIINRLRHRHLVRLVGWCHKKGTLLLVYDYMPNGSLDNHLFGGSEMTLSWDHRYTIIAGVASALHYLHNEYDQTVVHRDLKASNVMLDSNFNARLGDFGLARALDNEKTSYAELEGVPGTIGYIAPECFHTGKTTRESDVYGFGAVVLEVVCGQRPWTKIAGFQVLVDWVWKLYREGRVLEAVDERLDNVYTVEEAERLLLLGLACSHPIAAERPKTQAIVQIISGSVPAPDVPPFKPPFVWPAMDPTVGDSSRMMSNTTDTTPMNSSFDGSEYTPQGLSRESYVRYSDISQLV